MPGVWRARSLVCKGRKHTSSRHRYAETIRHSLRDGLRLIRALLGVPGLLATVACKSSPASLIPASGDQDHTTSLVRIRAARLRRQHVHRILFPTSATIGQTPLLVEAGCAHTITVFGKTEERYFCKRGWTRRANQ